MRFTLLHKIKQKHEENIPVFAERLLSLANQAYSDDSLRTAEVQKQLVNFFIDGLSYHSFILISSVNTML